MSDTNPTIVAASLSDEELKKSINALVSNIETGMNDAKKVVDTAVNEMSTKIKSLGEVKVDTGGASDGGSTRRAKKQNEEAQAVKDTVVSYDKLLGALQYAERFSRKKTFTADDLKAYEQALLRVAEIRKELERRQPELSLKMVNERQGVTDMREFVNSLLKPSESLKRLNDDYKEWEKTSKKAAETAITSFNEYSNKILHQADIVRQRMRESGSDMAMWGSAVIYDPSTTRERISIEEQLVRLHEASAKAMNQRIQAQQRLNAEEQKEKPSLGTYTNMGSVYEMQSHGNKVRAAEQEQERLAKTIAQVTNEYSKLESIVASFVGTLDKEVVIVTDTSASYTALSESLKKMKSAYMEMTQSERSSNKGMELLTNIQEVQRSISKINSEMQRPISLIDVHNLPEQTLEDITYKIKMLRSYLQGINVEADGGELKVKNVLSSIEKLDEKAKSIQKSVRQIVTESNSSKLENITKLPTENLDEVVKKIVQLRRYISELKSQGSLVDTKNISKAENMLDSLIKKAKQLGSIAGTKRNLVRIDKMPEHTLDQIEKKIRRISTIRMNLDVTKQRNEIESLNRKLDELYTKQKKVLGQNKDLLTSNNTIARSWNYMKNRLAFYLTVGAGTAFVNRLIEVRSQYELLERSIGILFDSMQTGSKIFAELNAMAIKSPFTTMELGSAAKQLSAYNIEAKDVVDTTRRLADMAAAVGIPIERLTYALGQIKSYGYLNSRDARMFANAGIPLIQNLADMYTKLEGRLVSVGDVYDRIKKKQVSFNDTLQVVNEMTNEGGRFFNFQEKAADTLQVKLANLTLSYNNFLNEAAKSQTGLINTTLGVIKELFEHWRDVENAVYGVATAVGIVKTMQLTSLGAILAARKLGYAVETKITAQQGLQAILGEKIAKNFQGIGKGVSSIFSMTGAITALLAALGYAVWQYKDLINANEGLNKSISDGAKENIDSIDKFFETYRKDIESVGSMSTADQAKLWEKVRGQIEKVSKNAQQYVEQLEKITDLGQRISAASIYLEQEKIIQDEAKRLADKGAFNIGGGFANDTLAKDLKQYEKEVNVVLKGYKSISQYRATATTAGTFEMSNYSKALKEADKELDNFIANLDKANLGRVMGGGSPTEQLANLRNYANLIRDNFLATEEGQKITIEGQSLLNRKIDEWIGLQIKKNRLTSEERLEVETNRTAWNAFFDQLNNDEKKALDYLISSGQTGSEAFKKIWNDAANRLKESNATLYDDISSKLANLSNTAPIVIDIIYRETKVKLDEQQQAFEDRWIKPKGYGALPVDEYLKQERENRTKYGRLMRQETEDNVEWEKRLGQEYQENLTNITSLNNQLKNSAKLTEADRKQKELERDALVDVNEKILDVSKSQGFNLEQFKKGNKGGKGKDILGEALTKEVQLVGEIQKRYEEYRKIGLNTTESLAKATDEYGNSLKNVGATLSKYGIATKTPEKLANMDLVKVRDYYKELLKGAKALGNAKGIEAIEKALANINVEIEKFSHKKIVDSLNNELGKLKDEYELAVELDATPEMSSVFMDAMGLSREDLEQLPRTYSQLAKKLQESIDKVFKDEGKDVKFDLENTLNDDEFKAWVEKNGHLLEAGWVEALNKIREFAQKTRLDEVKDTTKTWNELIGKYGGLSDKLLKITRDAINEEMGVIKQFGSKEQIERAFQITDDLKIKKDPLEVARLSRELMELLQAVIQGNPKAISITSAITTQEGRDKSKAEWDEFKNSDLYTMTFENMDKLSVRAIKHISEELDKLKDKVKEDPSSMKALMKSYEDLQDAMIKRRPFESIITSLKDWKKAAEEVKDAKIKLDEANKEVDQAESYKKSAEDVGELAMAEEQLTKAKEKQAKAQNDMLAAENKQARAQKNFQESINASASALNNFGSLLKQVTDLLGIAEDSEAGQFINEMVKGFQAMATVLGVVATVAILAHLSLGWVTIVAAALGALIGMLTWITNRKDNKIVKQIKDSENAVKDLELSYKKLKNAVEDAFGTAQVGAQSLLIVNKRLQLEETKRQLELQKSRKSKKYDADAIRDLESQVVDLEKEINDGIKEITDTLLGTSGVGDAVENMVGSVIDALRSGEDAMESWNDSIDDMIYNMIKKFVSTKVLAPIMQDVFDGMSKDLDIRGEEWKNRASDAQQEITQINAKLDYLRKNNWTGIYKTKIAELEARRAELEKQYEEFMAKASEVATPDEEFIVKYGKELANLKNNLYGIDDWVKRLSEEAGLQLGGNKELSALQQGIQGITEDTAGAIEAYMNIVSQRIFENGNILSEIRDAVVSFDMDIQLGTLSQMLLQLQASYQVQVSIQNILNGVLNPSGRAFVVELNS